MLRRAVVAIVLLVVLAAASIPFVAGAAASPVVRFSWGVGPYRWCPPLLADYPVSTGSQPHAFVTLLGHDAPHRGWRLELVLAAGDGRAFPDAWRFDRDGCAGEQLPDFYHVPPPIESCLRPFLASAEPPVIAARSFDRVYLPEEDRVRIAVRVELSAVHESPDPSGVYTLATIPFDHSLGVPGPGDGETACGGVERTVCLRLVSAAYLEPGGTWVEWPIDPAVASANGGGSGDCFAVPVQRSTWGAIKGHYR